METQVQQIDDAAPMRAVSPETGRYRGQRGANKPITPELVLNKALIYLHRTITNDDLPTHTRLQAARAALSTLHDAGIKPSERDLRVVFRRARRGGDDSRRDGADAEPSAPTDASVYTSNTSTNVYTAQPGEPNESAAEREEVQSEVLRPAGGTTQTDPAQLSLSPPSPSPNVSAVPVARCEHLSSKNLVCGRRLPCALHTPKYEPW